MASTVLYVDEVTSRVPGKFPEREGGKTPRISEQGV